MSFSFLKSQKVRIFSLGSSSSGNSTFIWQDGHSILVDFGFSTKYTKNKLAIIGKKISDIDAAVITHTHRDHISVSMIQTLTNLSIPIYIHENILNKLFTKKYAHYDLTKTLKFAEDKGLINSFTNEYFNINSFVLNSFEVPHDSIGGCFGFNIYNENFQSKKISFATDIGFVKEKVEEQFIDSDVIVIESNHDIEMLKNSGRPAILIDRIRSIGHLSNDESSNFINTVINKSKSTPHTILLAHLSQECNTSEKALSTMEGITNKFDNIKVELTHHKNECKIIEV